MTHDELLAKIDHHMLDIVQTQFNDYKAHKSLRAVVELHKPDPSLAPESLKYCICEEIYPCFTIQAIEKELQ